MAELYNEQAFSDLEKTFAELMKQADDIQDVLQAGADEFVKDLKKLPAPRSKINKAGYTHLIDTFASKPEDDQVLIGWGKYYGPMVEKGTKKMRARPHLKPMWQKNADKYYKLMQDKVIGGI